MGYHRLLTHRGYRAPKWVEYFLTFCGTLSLEDGPIFWVCYSPHSTSFVIPNLNQEAKRIPMSFVVLSSQRINLKNAVYNAGKQKDRSKDEAVNPVVQNSQKLIPSVTRVFRKNREMYVYLQAYEHNAPSVQPLLAFVGFYRANLKCSRLGQRNWSKPGTMGSEQCRSVSASISIAAAQAV